MVNGLSYPILLDNCFTLSITKLKELGYLTDNSKAVGRVCWGNGENTVWDISFELNTKEPPFYIELSYPLRGQTIKYKIELVKTQSNIGKGSFYYFLCPLTGKRCRILYFLKDHFLHRKAVKGCFYKKQIQSQKERKFFNLLEYVFAASDIIEALDSPYFKTSYKGEPTKRYAQLERKSKRVLKAIAPRV